MAARALFPVVLVGTLLGACDDGSYASSEWIIQDEYWQRRASHFHALDAREGAVVMVGDSLTDGAEWSELLGDPRVINRGINGDTAWGLAARLDDIARGPPTQIFWNIGTNDISWGRKTPAETRDKIADDLDRLAELAPTTEIVVESVLPVIDGRRDAVETTRVDALNALLSPVAAERGLLFVDLGAALRDVDGQLREDLTNDGLHLTGAGYREWASALRPFLAQP